jgi:hypothetical protein
MCAPNDCSEVRHDFALQNNSSDQYFEKLHSFRTLKFLTLSLVALQKECVKEPVLWPITAASARSESGHEPYCSRTAQ